MPNLNLLMDFLKLKSVESKKSVSSWVSFHSLTVLRVEKCVGMEYLFTPSTAKSLRLLKVMVISECQIMREIIATDDDDDEEQQQGSSSSSSSFGYNNNIVFHQLGVFGAQLLTLPHKLPFRKLCFGISEIEQSSCR